MIDVAIILLAVACYFLWQIAATPIQIKYISDVYEKNYQEQIEKLDRIDDNMSEILERLGGKVTMEELYRNAGI